MTTLEAIDLFKCQMIGEINHSMIDEISRDQLIRSVSDVAQLVIETLSSENSR